MSNLLLHAAGGMKTSDSGGREVIDEMLSVTPEDIRVSWSGTDRPEFTDFGAGKVCVEAERTNFIDYSEDFSEWSVDGSPSIVSSTVSDPYGGNTATSIDISGSSLTGFKISVNGGPGTYQYSIWARRNANSVGSQFRLRAVVDGGVETFTISPTGQWERYTVSFVAETGVTEVRVLNSNIHFMDIWRVQLEEGDYPTLDIPTSGSTVTRLAPTVPIQNALPETGTVGVVADAVRRSGDTYIFRNSDNFTTGAAYAIIGSTGNITAGYGGRARGDINTALPFSWDANTRRKFAYYQSWSADEIVCVFLLESGEIYKFSASMTPGGVTDESVIIGDRPEGDSAGSARFEVPWHKDEIIRTGATDEEIKAFFEFLTLGTSMQMTADEMEIVS